MASSVGRTVWPSAMVAVRRTSRPALAAAGGLHRLTRGTLCPTLLIHPAAISALTHSFMRTATTLASLILAVAVSSAVSAQSLLSTHGQILAQTGAPAPGIATATFSATSSFDSAVTDLNGTVLFRGKVDGGGSTLNIDDRGYWIGRGAGDLALMVRGGTQEPSNTLAGVLTNLTLSTGAQSTGLGGSPRIAPENDYVIFGTSLWGPSAGIIATGTAATTGRNDSAIYWGVPGNFQILARRGSTVPGTAGALFDSGFGSISYQTTQLNGSGIALFQSTLSGGDVSGTTNNFAWMYGNPSNLAVMLRKGDLVSVPGGDCAISAIGFGGYMNALGQVLHDETLSTTVGSAPATTATDKILMVYTPGVGNQILVREGDAAPGTVGAVFGAPNISTCAFTITGNTAFTCSLIGGDVSGTTNDAGIWYGGITAPLQMYIRKGDALPGATQGETISVVYTSSLQCNKNGQIATIFNVAGPNVTTANDTLIMVGLPGAFRTAAREGDAVPGLAGYTITSIVQGTSSPLFNDRGQIVFGCTITDATATSSGNAYMGWDPDAGLQLISWFNDTITGPGGPFPTPLGSGGVQFNNGDGSPLSFNNNGDVTYRVTYGNGQGAIAKVRLGGFQATPSSISTAGGSQAWTLDAGAVNGTRLYALAGTLSGTRPGFTFGSSLIPLNNDAWFNLSLAAANGAVYANTVGLLDAAGKATASFNYPPLASFAGATFHHAFVVLDPVTGFASYVSQPAALKIY